MQLTLRRRYRLGLTAMVLAFLGSALYAKRRLDAVQLELTHERAAAAEQVETMQMALNKALAEAADLQRIPRAGIVAASTAPIVPADSSLAMPPSLNHSVVVSSMAVVATQSAPRSVLRVPRLPSPSPQQSPPSGRTAVETVLRYIDARLLPPPDALNVIIMGSKQMLHRDKQFYLDAFHAIGFGTVEIGDASDPMVPWQPADPGWAGILCLSLTDGEEKCLHKKSYADLKPYQRIGRLPGLRHTLWNKDAFCRTLKTIGASAHRPAGIIEPPVPLESFSFNCWVLPAQFEELHRWGSDPTRRGQKYEN